MEFGSRIFGIRRWLPPFLVLALSLSATAQTNPLTLDVLVEDETFTVNRNISYFIGITNTSAVVLNDIQLAVSIPAEAQFVSAEISPGNFSRSGGQVIFNTSQLPAGQDVGIELNVRPLTAGDLTLDLELRADNVAPQSLEATETIYSANADLGIQLLSETTQSIVGDRIFYQLVATNLGPEPVIPVRITNQFPATATFLSIVPSNRLVSVTDGRLILELDSLQTNSGASFEVSIQPGAGGDLELSGGIGLPLLFDPDPTNNASSSSLLVRTATEGLLIVSQVSPQTFNPQTGLMEQVVEIRNTSTSQVESARLTISNFTHQVFNAAGTNSGSPYVVIARPIATNETVSVTLEYFIPTRTPTAENPDFTALAVPAVTFQAPESNPPNIIAMEQLESGGLLLEFEAVTGATYRILYDSDTLFTNALQAVPDVVAPGNRVQWIDNGPPKTATQPAAASSRFYRVIQLP